MTLVLTASGASSVVAAPCSGNDWQPTFVHDLDRADGGPWYVNAGGGFTKLPGDSGTTWVPAACNLINSQGLRDRRGFTTCQDYTRVQCGCRRADRSNTTCAAFLAGRP
jgi:hypothetical protein